MRKTILPATLIEQLTTQLSLLLQETFQQTQNLLSQGDFLAISTAIMTLTRTLTDRLWETTLQLILTDQVFLKRLRSWGSTQGWQFVSYQRITIILPTGTRLRVTSPFFVKMKPRRGRKRRGPQGRGSHLALTLLGFVDKVAPELAYQAAQWAVLAPSFDVASALLAEMGVALPPRKLGRLCHQIGGGSVEERVASTLEPDETLSGQRVVLGTDGGRLRTRRPKKGRLPKGKKRHGFYTDWVEPKLFTLHVLDEQGKVSTTHRPFVDGTPRKLPQFLTLLETYLRALEVDTAAEVAVVGDGAAWIWERIPALLKRLGVASEKIVEVLDWTHAIQNLNTVLRLVPQKARKHGTLKIRTLKKFLFEGQIPRLVETIRTTFQLTARSKSLKKLRSYFLANQDRMQYQQAEQRNVPLGSGVIESAIRRVVNLRLKSPGAFWTLKRAEPILFLRAQVLYGRWKTLVNTQRTRTQTRFQAFLVDMAGGKTVKLLN
jgi:hypothetical protein